MQPAGIQGVIDSFLQPENRQSADAGAEQIPGDNRKKRTQNQVCKSPRGILPREHHQR